jgi:hypothetical protein
MLTTLDKLQNQLLAALEPADYALLVPHLRTAHFAKGTVLQEQGAQVAHVLSVEWNGVARVRDG